MLVNLANQLTAIGNLRNDELIRLDLNIQIEIHHSLELDTGLSIWAFTEFADRCQA